LRSISRSFSCRRSGVTCRSRNYGFFVIPGRASGAGPESILPMVVMDSGLAAARRPQRQALRACAGNDGKARFRAPAARCARVVHASFAPENRGRGECRVPAAPAASRAMCWWHTSVVTTGAPEHPAFPHAMVLTVSFVLSPAIGLSCHRRLADMVLSKTRSGRPASAGLDAGVEASGPHDFAVRSNISRQRAVNRSQAFRPALPSRRALRRCRVHRIPPRVRDDRDTPLVGWDGGSSRSDLGWAGTEIFLQMGLDTGQITRLRRSGKSHRLTHKSRAFETTPPSPMPHACSNISWLAFQPEYAARKIA